MSSGFKWNEDVPYNNPENSEVLMTKSPNPIKYVLSQPILKKPGSEWRYNGGTVQLLAAIIEKATGKKIDEYANENLFIPMGIKTFQWYKFPGTTEPSAASGLRFRSRDMLKFGILCQQNGNWQGKQIVPKTWVQQSFLKSMNVSSSVGYGYLFWKEYIQTAQKYNLELTVANGNGDQRIFFDDKNKLIVVVTAGNYNGAGTTEKTNARAMLKDYIYASFIK